MISEQLSLKLKYYKFYKDYYSGINKADYENEIAPIFTLINNYVSRPKETRQILTEIEFVLNYNNLFNDFVQACQGFRFEPKHIKDQDPNFIYDLLLRIEISLYHLSEKEFLSGKYNNEKLRNYLFEYFSSCNAGTLETKKAHLINKITASPNLGKLFSFLVDCNAKKFFNDRGIAKPKKYKFCISDKSSDIAEMSMRGIRNCQSWDDRPKQAFSNLLDPTLSIAWIEDERGYWLARSLVRQMVDEQGQVVFGIDAYYGREAFRKKFFAMLTQHIKGCGHDIYLLNYSDQHSGLRDFATKTLLKSSKPHNVYVKSGNNKVFMNAYMDSCIYFHNSDVRLRDEGGRFTSIKNKRAAKKHFNKKALRYIVGEGLKA